MKLPRRGFLHLAVGATALSAVSRVAKAQSYPSRPIRIVVGLAAGSSPDITARLMAQSLSERLRQPIIIDNRPGAGTTIATEAVVRAVPDGYTLLWTTTTAAVSATLYDKLKFNFIRDMTPVAGVCAFPLVMLVNPSLSAQTVSEFIAYAKDNPGKINMASSTGIGGMDHVAGELFKMLAGVDLVHVPFRTTPFAELLNGQVQVWFPALASSIGYIKSGQLRALAVTTATRSGELPDIPTIGEFVRGYEASVWHGIAAPKETPVAIVDKINREVDTGLADPTLKVRFRDLGGAVLSGSPTDFGKLIAEETEKWAKVIKSAGIKAQ
jgi:tripartite-type tricarboxylate transporter receptor subunit TctC